MVDMASSGTPSMPTLSDRADVHKSCKSLETLVNILNDYCEAAGAVVSLQKKLAKSLRDTAALKVTGEIASNAMNASASIFEVLAEIDAKFSRFADKETESISTEVRKWFKKLVKEEKAHDERLSSANARIKQAGQLYEKKSKRNARDAGEEHAKYISLISTLGPEISQEKYNHVLQVTQRHTLMNYSVAACLSRVADAQWLRTCEGVRRFSPVVGQLGEWRALCEGGWTGQIPKNLPSVDSQESGQPNQEDSHSPQPDEEESPTLPKALSPEQKSADGRPSTHPSSEHIDEFGVSQPQQSRNKQSNSSPSVEGQSQSSSSSRPNSMLDHPKPSSDIRDKFGTLSVFPTPPSHFPISPMQHTADSQKQGQSQSQSQSLTQTQSGSAGGIAILPRVAESSQNSDLVVPEANIPVEGSDSRDGPPSPLRSDANPTSHAEENRGLTRTISTEPNIPFLDRKPSFSRVPENVRRRLPTPPPQLSWPTIEQDIQPPARGSSLAYDKEDHLEDGREFGMRNDGYGQYRSRTVDAIRPTATERRDSTASSGSIVAAMRNRYSYNTGVTSATPRDIPRIPLSVTDLATRYQPSVPLTPRRRGSSPPVDRQLPFLDTITQAQMMKSSLQDGSSPSYVAGEYASSPSGEDDLTRGPQQRVEDQTEIDLREREREIEQRAKELERDRARLATVRSGRDDGYTSSKGGAHSNQQHQQSSQQRPYQQVDFPPPQPPYSRSTTHLVLPSSQQHSRQPQSQPSSPAQGSDHAAFCGCDSCSIAKYKTPTSPSAHDLRPPERPINLRPDKPKGSWIRRLSMPVGLSLDSKKNASSSNLRMPVHEDGRIYRRSFEAGGINNRSVTNLRR